MKRQTLTISLTPRMLSWIRERANAEGFPSVSAYLRRLLENDARHQRNLAAMLREQETERKAREESDAKIFRRYGGIRRGQRRNPRVK